MHSARVHYLDSESQLWLKHNKEQAQFVALLHGDVLLGYPGIYLLDVLQNLIGNVELWVDNLPHFGKRKLLVLVLNNNRAVFWVEPDFLSRWFSGKIWPLRNGRQARLLQIEWRTKAIALVLARDGCQRNLPPNQDHIDGRLDYKHRGDFRLAGNVYLNLKHDLFPLAWGCDELLQCEIGDVNQVQLH